MGKVCSNTDSFKVSVSLYGLVILSSNNICRYIYFSSYRDLYWVEVGPAIGSVIFKKNVYKRNTKQKIRESHTIIGIAVDKVGE